LPDDVVGRVAVRAQELGISRSEFFARAAENYLDLLDATSTTVEINSGDSQTWSTRNGDGLRLLPLPVNVAPMLDSHDDNLTNLIAYPIKNSIGSATGRPDTG
jgi:hypothetical protein